MLSTDLNKNHVAGTLCRSTLRPRNPSRSPEIASRTKTARRRRSTPWWVLLLLLLLLESLGLASLKKSSAVDERTRVAMDDPVPLFLDCLRSAPSSYLRTCPAAGSGDRLFRLLWLTLIARGLTHWFWFCCCCCFLTGSRKARCRYWR